MLEDEAPLTPDERLLVASLYASLTSKDVLRPRQHNAGNAKRQVERSHILVSHSLSHNQSHRGSS
ncbi:Uncharacterised protein [Mycobacteroides abscessus subsp. abscessus]|nr:Uncharacterised protein [Mycobacteroides abscessus]SHT52150.1 Uncharacterised protein [Mycobacteroides abscessus subsp. abscessus]SHT56721.1 Uncharacterised protein [Mycobacteroides abscessus subsp. abscessus]SHX21227.1 Uncharacterised protein [Mycobacteroides abscessus subsp. abscessus]SKK64771.1 Uncharacterised protein [Mycobacteroides abscessus subsp. abscessus]